MEPEYNWEMITRYVLNESSDKEKREIESNIQSDSNFEKIIQEMRQVASVKQKPLQLKDVNLKWEEIKADLAEVSPEKQQYNSHSRLEKYKSNYHTRKKIHTVWKYAAILLFAIGISYFLSKESHAPEETAQIEYKTLFVKNGERKTIVLYDGTTINLDSGSELKYPKKFGDLREVYLKGEAFFQVAKNSDRPFHIYVDNALVQVIGTKFNIRSWDEDSKGVTVTVTEGKVAFGSDNPNTPDKVILTKNMQSSLSRSGELSKPIIVDASNFSRWMHSEIDFQNASLKQIITQLERWYDIQFVIDDELLERKNLNIHLNNTNLNEVLNLISTIANTKVERHGKKIFISK